MFKPDPLYLEAQPTSNPWGAGSITLTGRVDLGFCQQSCCCALGRAQTGTMVLMESTSMRTPKHSVAGRARGSRLVYRWPAALGGSHSFSWHRCVDFCSFEGITWFRSGGFCFKNVHLYRSGLCRQTVFMRERENRAMFQKVYFKVLPTIWSDYAFKVQLFSDKLTSQIRKLNTIIKA